MTGKNVMRIFETELDSFRIDAESSMQYFAAYLAIHQVSAKHNETKSFINEFPVFWNTTLSALLSNTFIAIGRIFDTTSPHNLRNIFKLITNNPEIFNKESLRYRKRAGVKEKPEWLDRYIKEAYEPNVQDIRDLREESKRLRKIYLKTYKSIRDKVYAHKEVSSQEEVEVLFEKTNRTELYNLIESLVLLYDKLWGLYNNGENPNRNELSYSPSVMEHITGEVENLFRSARCL